jgi:tetratricopeptide (TPR) repeat protein
MSKRKNKPHSSAAPESGKPLSGHHSPSVAPAAVSKSMPEKWLLAGCLLLTFLVFANTLGAGFVNWDDHGYLWLNPLVQPLSGKALYDMFTGHTCGAYAPLVALTYAVEHSFDTIVQPGQQVAANFNPFTYHLTNVLLHLGTTALAFFLLRALGLRGWALGFATALFGIHPLRSESVAWVTERKDVLYGLFYVGALLTYWKYVQAAEGKSRWYLLTLLLGVLSLFSKIQAVSLPLSFLALDYWARRDFRKTGLWVEKLPFFVLSFVIGLVGIHFVSTAGGFEETGYPGWARFLFGAWSLVEYTGKVFLPLRLSTYYPYPNLNAIPFYYYIAPLVVVALGWGVWRLRRQQRVLVFGALFFLLNILFVLQIKGAGKAFLADRFTYIPYLGLFFILGYYLQEIAEGRRWRGGQKMALIGAAAFVAILSVLTFLQNATWKSSVTLWENATSKYPDDYLGWNNKGLALDEEERYEEAIKAYEAGNKVNPSNYDSYHNLGVALYKTKRYAEAIRAFTQAAANKPGETEIYWNRAMAYRQTNAYAEAIADYNKILQIPGTPRTPQEIHFNIATTLAAANRHAEAVAAFTTALRIKDDPDSRYQKGNSLAALGDMNAAVAEYDAAVRLKADFADAWNNRGNALAVLNRLDEAIVSFDQALSHQPQAGNIYCNRGMAKNSAGRRAEACADWQTARQLGYEQGGQLLAQFCK